MSELARLSVEGSVAELRLNRPESRNAMSEELLHTVTERVGDLAGRAGVRVAVLTGEGKAFCAGMDLKAVVGQPEAGARLLEALAELTVRLRALPMVTVAKVNGAAIGGGCGLACVCDVAVTHADSKMGFPEVDLGVCPAVVAPWVVRKIGAGRARRVLLSGGVMSGREAHAIGLVDYLVETHDELDAAADELVDRLSGGGGEAIRATKSLLNELDGSGDAERVRRGALISARVLASDEAQAALRARLKG